MRPARPAPKEGFIGRLQKAATAAEFEAALKRGAAATRDGNPYLVEVATARYGGGAESAWYEKFNLAEKRKRRA